MYGYIYKTTNLINGKIYIGQHKGKFDKNYLGSGFALRNSINKYGKENFSVEVLCICETLEGTNEAEFQYIEEYNSMDRAIGYNLRAGGMQPGMTEETREKMKKAKENYKPWNIGVPHTEESKIKMSENRKGINKGVPKSKEWKDKASSICQERLNNGLFKGQKKVRDNKTGIIYRSLRECERETGVLRKTISANAKLNNKSKSKYDFDFI